VRVILMRARAAEYRNAWTDVGKRLETVDELSDYFEHPQSVFVLHPIRRISHVLFSPCDKKKKL
jgi:hypothetical protein